MKRRRRISPKDDAKYHVSTGKDKPGFDVQHISVFKGRGVFTSYPFEKGDFLLEYQGELISKQECERRQRLYHDSLKVFMFEFQFNGKLWCVDAAKEDGTLGRLVNDDHVNPNAKMKYMVVEGKPHLCLFATRDISPGEEITYDYGDSDWPWRCKGEVEKASGPQHTKKVDRPHHTEMAAGSQTHTSPVPRSPSRVGKDDVEKADGGPQHTEKADGGPQRTEKADGGPQHTEKADGGPQHTEKADTEMAAGSQTLTSPVPRSPSRVGKDDVEKADGGPQHTEKAEKADGGPQHTEKAEKADGGPQHTEKAEKADGGPQHTEKADTEMAAGSQTLTSPVPRSPSRIGKDDVEKADGGPQHTEKADGGPQHTEKADGGPQHTEVAAGSQTQTSPVPSSPSRVGKDDVEKADGGPQHTDKADTEMATGSQTPTSPVPRSPSRVGKCKTHRLVFTTVSTLDKCLQCVGPVSSLKWLGYKCKDCSGVWHKSCLSQIVNDQLNHPSLEKHFFQSTRDKLLSGDQESAPHSEVDEISDEDSVMSDEEYVPDSESPEDSDVSLFSGPQHTLAGTGRLLPDAGTSFGSDTSIPVVEGIPEGSPLLDDHMIHNAPETSDLAHCTKKSPKEKSEVEAQLHNPESTDFPMTKKNFCYICGKPQSKISRHLKTHSTHPDIVRIFSLPEESKERKILLEKMRNKGNFKHNTAVLQGGTGPIKVKRKTKAKAVTGKFIHCMYCQGLYIRKELWRHARRCPCKPEDKDSVKEPGRSRVLALASAQESMSSHQISSGVWKLLSTMKQDDIASVVRNDLSIIQFAQSLYNRHGQDLTKNEYMRQKLREVGRLMLCLRTDFSVHNMEEAVKPANFQRLVQAVRKVSGFDQEKHTYETPSLALKLGHTLHKISDIIHCRALMAEDEDLIRSSDIFKKLYTSKWSELVSHKALNTLSDAKYNKPSTIPFTEDVQTLHRYLEKSAENAMCNLKAEATPQSYAELAKVTLAQIIVFNRRRAGEVSKMRLKNFNERDNTKLHEDVAAGLSKTEQRLCNYFSRIEIMGKRGRKVAILLTPTMLTALSLLTSRRTECGVCATNVFLFARPKSMTYYRGQDCLRVYANQCGAKHPEHLRSTHLRKHVATLSQVLNLKNNELDQVADFMGHDIRVHRDFYRLPVPVTQLAKISKLLLSMEKGQISNIQGKSLDDIEIEDSIVLSDHEPKENESDSDDCESAEADSTVADQAHDNEGFTGAVSSSAGTVSTQPKTASLSLCEGKDVVQEPRRMQKRGWSKPEVTAVMRHFKNHISKGNLATKAECDHCKLVEGPVLAHRTVQNIRDFVRNRGVAVKRQSVK